VLHETLPVPEKGWGWESEVLVEMADSRVGTG
jgi:hypothetical protein